MHPASSPPITGGNPGIICIDTGIDKRDDWAIRAIRASNPASSQGDTWAFLGMGSLAACSTSVPPDASCAL